MAQRAFPPQFLWGVATASYQVEGAVDAEGRGKSIWDTFSHTPGKVTHGHTGDVSCDQFHRYAEDVELMKELGVGAYRFSIAWPRVFPEGSGQRNPQGFDYYHRLIDALLEADIKPCPTLYHWDLPQALEDAGGWPERETARHFAEYAQACFEELGDKVEMWITFNEQPCICYGGYGEAWMAPGRRDMAQAFRAVHHTNLAHGLAVQAFRDVGRRGKIGVTHNAIAHLPASRREEDIRAAALADDKQNRMYLGPLYGKGYPQRYLEKRGLSVPVEDGDMEQIARPTDFLGLNFYFQQVVRADEQSPDGYAGAPMWQERTDFNWPITPQGIRNTMRWLSDEYGAPPIYVTENGCAMPDVLSADGTACRDPRRIDLLKRYIGACAEAIAEGIDLRGYFLWSFIDNFEWLSGYTKRFGIVYCDYVNQRRVPKDSFYWYRDCILGYAEL